MNIDKTTLNLLFKTTLNVFAALYTEFHKKTLTLFGVRYPTDLEFICHVCGLVIYVILFLCVFYVFNFCIAV